MKKLFLLLSFIFMVGIAKAQTPIEWWQPSTTQWLTVSDSIFHVGSGINAQYFGPLPVTVISIKSGVSAINDTSNAYLQAALLTKLSAVLAIDSAKFDIHGGGYSDTTSAAGDTVIPTGVTKNWWVTVSTDDTIYVSRSGTFPTTDLYVLLPGSSFTYEHLSIFAYPKIYYKLKGTGIPNVGIIWGGY